MNSILKREGYVPVDPEMMNNPFYKIQRVIKEEIRKHKWIEGEKGRSLTWVQAHDEWMERHYEEWRGFFNNEFSSIKEEDLAEFDNILYGAKEIQRIANNPDLLRQIFGAIRNPSEREEVIEIINNPSYRRNRRGQITETDA